MTRFSPELRLPLVTSIEEIGPNHCNTNKHPWLFDETKEHSNNLQICCKSLKAVLLNQAVFITRIKLDIAVFTHVHGHTTDTRPAVPLGLVFVVGTAGLQDGLVNTTATSNNTCQTQ